MTTGRKYFSGNTLEMALMQAARHHGLQPEEVAYHKVEKRHGFLRTRRGVVIEVDPESPRRVPRDSVMATSESPVEEPLQEDAVSPEVEMAAPAPVDAVQEPDSTSVGESTPVLESSDEADVESTELSTSGLRDDVAEAVERESEEDESMEDLIAAAHRGLQEIMGFAKLDLQVEVTEGEGQLEIELTGQDRDRLVEDRGNLLLSIQHLLPRLIRGYTGRSIPCHVDSEQFHAGREVELRKLAEEAAQEVRERQRPRTLPPMNPAERRIIHVTLADNKEVATESQGKGFFKRVTISPAMRRPRGFDRYS